MTLRILLDQFDRQLRAFDARPRHAKPVREVPQRACHSPPTATNTRLGHAGFLTVRRLLLDDEIERHEAREQVAESLVEIVSYQRQRERQRHAHRAVHARHRQRCVFQRLHQHATLLGPKRNALGVEHVSRQSVHLADETCRTESVGVHVVRREVIAAAHHQSFQITSFTRHPVQRVDAAHD